ncbi:MAG: elongation factor G [bacterium]|nr:elongation factor G [bacterium]
MAAAAKKGSLISTTTENRQVSMELIRNIGIIAHIDAGKTTTTERILFESGKTYKQGSVDEGNTVTDWMEQERERGITIVSAAITTFWTPNRAGDVSQEQHRVNIIDTPGHIDFTVEVERSLRVLDGACMIFDGRTGVEPQSETVWRQADKYKVPRFCSLNKLNLIGADFEGSIQSIRERLSPNAAAIDIPIGSEHELHGVVDLIEMKAFTYKDQNDKELTEGEIPAEYLEKAKKFREELLEKVAEYDDEVLEKFLNGDELSVAEIKRAVRKGTTKGEFFPILGGDNRMPTVQRLLDAIVEYLPSPIDIPPVKGINPKTEEVEERKPDNAQPFSALAFKLIVDKNIGKLVMIRIYSGTLKAGTPIYNSTKRTEERAGRLVLLHADRQELIEEAYAGEIVAVVGLKSTITGDTICDIDKQIILESITFPEPVISLAIEPKTRQDQEKLGYAMNRLGEEDPTFRVKTNHETGQTIISGMGELQLEVLVDRMKREFGVEATTGAPQVAYKETIKKLAQGEGKYIRQTGGRGQYGHCLLKVEPKGRGEGFEFVSEIKGGSIPQEYIGPIEKGVKEAMENGVLAGFPMVDMKVAVYDGSFHDVDSSEIAFKIAGSMAFQAACRKADLALLEPIMKVFVSTPDQFVGDVMGDLSSRRAQISGTETRGVLQVVEAFVPLSELQGYATALRSMSQGRASSYMEASHYAEVPVNIVQQIIIKQGKAQAVTV